MEVENGHLSLLKAQDFFTVLQHISEIGLGFEISSPHLGAYSGVRGIITSAWLERPMAL